MKRFLSLLFTTLLLTVALCVTASASDFDAVAEDLSAIGMFRGTANGFELDRAPTRSEAAIMLVRLYGAEEAAKTAYEAGEISHPFTDVSDFTSPYVAWLYTNGITNGFTETTFASQRPCSAQNYATFLLRALGYKDGEDFQYADALVFAQEKGFYEPIMFSGEFLRDDLAALTYQGLAADTADGETYLLDKLIQDGAIDADAAKPMTETFEAYRAMESAFSDMDENAMDMDINMDMNVRMEAAGEVMEMPTSTTGSVATIVDGSDVEMAYALTTVAEGTEMDMGMWLKDGWMYMSMSTEDGLLNVKAPVEDELAVMEEVGTVDVSAMDVSGLAMIDSITSKKNGSNTEYTMVVNQGMGGMFDSVSAMTGNEVDNTSISDMTITYVVDRNGVLKNMNMVFSAGLEMPMPMEDGTVMSMKLQYDYIVEMTIKATGSSVRIKYPDFSKFTEITYDEMDALA